MNFREWVEKQSEYFLVPEVIYAAEFLEYRGEIFGIGFQVCDAIDKATKMYCDFLDEEWNG